MPQKASSMAVTLNSVDNLHKTFKTFRTQMLFVYTDP